MVQLRKRFEKAESDKSISADRLRTLSKELRQVCKHRDDERERAEVAARCWARPGCLGGVGGGPEGV